MKAFTINNKLIKVGSDVIGKTIPFEGIIVDIQGTHNNFYRNSEIPAGKIFYLDELIWDSYEPTSFGNIRDTTGLDFNNTVELKIIPYNNNNRFGIIYGVYLDIKQWGSFSFSYMNFQRTQSLSISASDAPIFSQDAVIGFIFNYCQDFNSDISHWDVQNVSYAGNSFTDAISFNQDLSSWYFPLIATMPYGFALRAESWTLPKPNFGSSPP